MKAIYEMLYKVAIQLKRGYWGLAIYRFLDGIGVRCLVNRIYTYYYYRKKNVILTWDTKKSTDYFDANGEIIQQILSILADNESRNVFSQMIMFRKTGNISMIPQNRFRTQYFKQPFWKYRDDGEVYIDCGAYDGDTIYSFKKVMKRYHVANYSIVAIEPDLDNCEQIKKRYPESLILQHGIWSEKTKKKFIFDGGMTARVVDDTCVDAQYIEMDCIDNIKECYNATFIKMDIEGAEFEALKGASHTIIRNMPKLAISIYHSDEDMLRIILYIKSLVPQYKIYVRQHTNGISDTVMYATI